MMKKLSVVVADDHSIVLLGIRDLLERSPGYCLVGQASNSSALVQVMEDAHPDILITDYCMPGDSFYGDGVKFIDYLCRSFPQTRILIFTMMSNPLILSTLYEIGVSGVVLKSWEGDELLTALATLGRGRIYRGKPPLVSSVLSIDTELMARVSSLSINELEVLRDFVMGLSPQEIALKKNRSIKTISAQKISAMRKLNAVNDQMLMKYCIQARMFE